MHHGTDRDVAQRQGITVLDRRIDARLQGVTSLHATGRDNIPTFTVRVQQKREVRAAVRIVFQALDLGRDPVLVALEVDDTIMLLVPATHVTRGDAAIVVATARLALLFGQRTYRSPLVEILGTDADDVTATRRSRFCLDDSHGSLPVPYSAPVKSMSWPSASVT